MLPRKITQAWRLSPATGRRETWEARPPSTIFYDPCRRIEPLYVMRKANPHVLSHTLADQSEHAGCAGMQITQAWSLNLVSSPLLSLRWLGEEKYESGGGGAFYIGDREWIRKEFGFRWKQVACVSTASAMHTNSFPLQFTQEDRATQLMRSSDFHVWTLADHSTVGSSVDLMFHSQSFAERRRSASMEERDSYSEWAFCLGERAVSVWAWLRQTACSVLFCILQDFLHEPHSRSRHLQQRREICSFLEHSPDGSRKRDRNCCNAGAWGKGGGSAEQIWGRWFQLRGMPTASRLLGSVVEKSSLLNEKKSEDHMAKRPLI